MRLKNLWPVFRRTLSDWNDHEAPRLGAALSFYTILSVAPLLILVIAVVALGIGRSAAQDQILDQVQGMMGRDGASAVRTVIEHSEKPASGSLTYIIGAITILFGASGVYEELRSALNKIWNVKPASAGGIVSLIKRRFFSFGMVLAIGFLLLVSLVVNAAIAASGRFVGGILPIAAIVLRGINFIVSFVVVAVLFALIFKYVPETKIAWRDVRPGAIATAALFTLGKFLIGVYLSKAAVGSAYGPAGSLIVVIVWVYYSSMIFFFGAEFTHVLARTQQERTKRG
jgi:membrane protein